MALAKEITNSQIREKATYEDTPMYVANMVKDKQKELGSSTLTPALIYIVVNQNNFEKIIKPSVNSDINAIVNNANNAESIIRYSSMSDDDKVFVNQHLKQIKDYSEHIKESINNEYMPKFPALIKKSK